MGQEITVPGKAYPSLSSAYSPNACGGGGGEFGYTGSAAIVVDCTAIVDKMVQVFSEVASDGSDGSAFRYFWNDTAVAPALASASAAADKNPTAKFYKRFSGASPVSEAVDADRPYLICYPGASIVTAENIIVAVDEPTETT